ncbi:MAG: sulfotransferase [Acidimicrobiales bacterium]|nr:sulfotransferase [Acidimicrobiales bacterium]
MKGIEAGSGERQKLLFIGGLGRSGSTLIEKLLNEYNDAFAIGESVHLWERGLRDNELCGCGEAFDECPFWQQVGTEAFGRWSEIDLPTAISLRWKVDRSRQLRAIGKAHRRGFPSDAQQEYLDLIGNVLLAAGRAARIGTGATVVIDSSKHLSAAALYALDPRLDVRVLHLLRDPRGVAYSWTKAISRPEAASAATMKSMPRYNPVRTAGRWVTDNLGFARLTKLEIPVFRLRYEDFLDAPLESLTAIAEFAGIDADSLPSNVVDGRTAHVSTPMHSVAGNPLRFGASKVTLKLDDAWREKLPAPQRLLVSAITAPARGRFGY